jgi:hypothetical protein
MNLAAPKPVHVFVGLIARHTLTVATHVTLSRLKVEANALGMKVSEETEESGGIALARNLLVERFFDKTEADWFLSFDDDVGRFRGSDLARMVSHGVAVVGAPLPGRAIQPASVQAALAEGLAAKLGGAPTEGYLALHESLSPLLVKYLDEGPRWIQSPAGPICEVRGTSAGCLLISRAAIGKLIDREGRFAFNDRRPPRLFDFTEAVPDDSYGFCQRWRELGGKVYVDGRTTLSHVGLVHFTTRPLVTIHEVVERGA